MKTEITLHPEILKFLVEKGCVYMENDWEADYKESYYMFPDTIFFKEELTGKLYTVTEKDIPKQLRRI